jgi:Putative prokaryotic signal transducing protein
MKKLYSAQNLQEAHLVMHLLAHAGIEARVFNENLQGALGDIPFGEAYPQIWLVREKDSDRAKQVVQEYERGPVEKGSIWCRSCGEENPRHFQICWSCTRSID